MAMKKQMHVRHIKTRRWKVVEPPFVFDGCPVEDLSIITEDEKSEVVGCSEWMRSSKEIFDHIVSLHNSSIK